MPIFAKRSDHKELLDRDDIPFEDIKENMQELNTINHWLGGHSITIKGIQHFYKSITTEPLQIVEIGCGGGDNLRAIKKWAEKKHINVTLSGIDINKECIQFAESEKGNKEIQFIQSDYRDMKFEKLPHIIFSSLFCHHFNDKELQLQLRWMYEHSLQGFFINDLHRHPLAYYSIKGLTRIFSKSYLIKNDAPLSVLRGFHKREWEKIAEAADIRTIKYQWCWAFRWLLLCDKS